MGQDVLFQINRLYLLLSPMTVTWQKEVIEQDAEVNEEYN